ncbi:MAG TPA: tetratricopeptide repeat protein [Xanthobacteraceae bacterium]|nr:tetratricopeptide repeat protein [Xanthobacteraceae bacterium]
MTDIFHEVDEEVRREQLKKLWERYGNYLIAGCIVIVLGVGAWRGYQWWQAKQAAQSGAAFEQAVTLAETGKHQEAADAFAKVASDGTSGYRVLARLRQAAELAPTDRNAAVAAYDAIATDNRTGQIVQDLAAVRAAFLLVDSAPYSEILQRLEPVTAADRAFRHSAREILALSAWKAGDMAAARRWTEMIMTDPQTPPGPRTRAEMLSELIAAASAKG